jgi:hypothetical protein
VRLLLLSQVPLFLEHVRFEPAPPLTCRELNPATADVSDVSDDGSEPHAAPHALPPGPLTGLLAQLLVLPPAGGARHWLFLLERPPPPAAAGASGSHPHVRSAAAAAAIDASGALGRLDMRWRGPLGDGGRLQTQAIMGAPPPRRDVSITLEQARPHGFGSARMSMASVLMPDVAAAPATHPCCLMSGAAHGVS